MMEFQKIADELGILRNDRLKMTADELLSFIYGTVYVIMQERKHLKQRIAKLERDQARLSQMTVWDYRRPCEI